MTLFQFMRRQFTSNLFLSYIALAYNLHAKLEHNLPSGNTGIKILADLVEIHLGALDTEGRRDEAAAWIRGLLQAIWLRARQQMLDAYSASCAQVSRTSKYCP